MVLFYPYNFWIKFSISDHCDSQQVQRFAKIRRIWSNFPILACTKAELRYIMFSVCYSDTPSNQGFFKRQLFWDLPCLEENNFSPKKKNCGSYFHEAKKVVAIMKFPTYVGKTILWVKSLHLAFRPLHFETICKHFCIKWQNDYPSPFLMKLLRCKTDCKKTGIILFIVDNNQTFRKGSLIKNEVSLFCTRYIAVQISVKV